MFNAFWKAMIILSLVLALLGSWMGWRNHQRGVELTAWAGNDLLKWVTHVQNCHSPSPHLPPESPQCGNGPTDHIGTPPPPPGWDW